MKKIPAPPLNGADFHICRMIRLLIVAREDCTGILTRRIDKTCVTAISLDITLLARSFNILKACFDFFAFTSGLFEANVDLKVHMFISLLKL